MADGANATVWQDPLEVDVTRAVLMTPDQIENLIASAKHDLDLWHLLKERELENESRLEMARVQGKWLDLHADEFPPPTRPSWSELLVGFLKTQYGADYVRFEDALFGIELRKQIRKELNLPV